MKTRIVRFTDGVLSAAMYCAILCTAALHAISAPAGTSITNVVTVQYRDLSGGLMLSASAQVSTLVSGAPVLKITLNPSSDPVMPGDQLIYTIGYENTGNAPATGVVLNDQLTVAASFVSATGGGVFDGAGNKVVWNIGAVPVGSSGELKVTVNISTAAAGGSTVPNTTSITSSEGSADSKTINTLVGEAPNLKITCLAVPSVVVAGGAITYTIQYANIGNKQATGVQIRDALPSGVSLVNGSITGGGTVSGGAVVWNPSVVNAGSSGTVSFQVNTSTTFAIGHVITDAATILSAELGVILSNQAATTIAAPRVSLAVSDAPDPVIAAHAAADLDGANTQARQPGSDGRAILWRQTAGDEVLGRELDPHREIRTDLAAHLGANRREEAESVLGAAAPTITAAVDVR